MWVFPAFSLFPHFPLFSVFCFRFFLFFVCRRFGFFKCEKWRIMSAFLLIAFELHLKLLSVLNCHVFQFKISKKMKTLLISNFPFILLPGRVKRFQAKPFWVHGKPWHNSIKFYQKILVSETNDFRSEVTLIELSMVVWLIFLWFDQMSWMTH